MVTESVLAWEVVEGGEDGSSRCATDGFACVAESVDSNWLGRFSRLGSRIRRNPL